jgi:chromosome segregation ATPase
MEQLSQDNARITSELSGALSEGTALREGLADATTRIGSLEGSIRSLSSENRKLIERYDGLKKSIGEFLNEVTEFGKDFGDFGTRLQDAVRFVLEVSERS